MTITYADAYDEMLDECYPLVRFGHLTYSPSAVLREVDPVAYRCGFVDWTAALSCEKCSNDFSADVEEGDDYAPVCPDCIEQEAVTAAEIQEDI